MRLKTHHLILLTAPVLILSSCASPPPQPQQPPQPPAQVVEEEEPIESKPKYIQVAHQEAGIIGQKIWMNEGSAKVENLTVWNKGEKFASLGIGHFIWYPAAQEGRYHETFPDLVVFLQKKGVKIPTWLQNTPDAPWNSLEAFRLQEQSPQMEELRQLLVKTIPQQVQFIIKRLEKALPTMLENLDTEEKRTRVRKQFYRVAKAPNGVYALIDYVNFKGEGTKPTERYNGQGWGLLQVLENMSEDSDNVMAEFARAAEFTLKRRIQNSPPERNESRWMEGWKNRVRTYAFQ